jgi:hypothetical protein
MKFRPPRENLYVTREDNLSSSFLPQIYCPFSCHFKCGVSMASLKIAKKNFTFQIRSKKHLSFKLHGKEHLISLLLP